MARLFSLDSQEMAHRAVGSSPATRWLTAGLLGVAGLGHVPLISEHLDEAPYMGVLFALFVVSCLVVAAGLALTDSSLWYAGAGGLCLAAFLTFVATRLVSFPQLSDDVGAWLEPFAVLCLSAEMGVVAVTAAVLWSSESPSPAPRHRAATASAGQFG